MKVKNFKNRRGITLVALVITIIVLLILAGITINLTIGQDGIITTAQDAGVASEKGKATELAQLAYLDKQVEVYGAKPSDETTLSVVMGELEKNGYEVITVADSGSTYDGVEILEVVDSTGSSVSNVALQQGDSKTIQVKLKMTTGTSKSYVKIKNKYYEIKVENGEISLSDEGLESTQGEQYTIRITPTTEKSTMTLGDTAIESEQQIASGANITVTATQVTGEENFTIEVKKADGTTKDIITGKVTVSTKAIHANSITVKTKDENKVESIKVGVELELKAITNPTTITDEIVWSSSDNNIATVDSTGKVTGVSAGSVTITATVTNSENNTTLSDSYQLTIEAQEVDCKDCEGTGKVDALICPVCGEQATSYSYEQLYFDSVDGMDGRC